MRTLRGFNGLVGGGKKGGLATEDFKKPGFCEKPGFCWANTPNNRKLNVGRGQSSSRVRSAHLTGI